MTQLLCVVSKTPYADSHSLELIETGMVAAVFDFSVGVLFRDDGVWALLADQDATFLQRRTLSKVLTALPAYDIDSIYVCSESLKQRKIAVERLCLPVQIIDFAEQQQLIAAQDVVMGAQS